MTDFNHNPFQAPQARVDDVCEKIVEGQFITEGRRVPAGNAMKWLSQAWGMFTQTPGTWIGILFVLMLIVTPISLIPVVGVVSVFLIPILVGGVMLGCKAQERGEAPKLDHLFRGFAEFFGPLAVIGLLYMVGSALAAQLLEFLLKRLDFGNLEVADIMFVAFAYLVPTILLIMSIMYAPALVVFHGVDPVKAMVSSFKVCLKNLGPLTVLGLISFVLMMIGAIFLGLGLLVVIPVLQITTYVSYRDIFIKP